MPASPTRPRRRSSPRRDLCAPVGKGCGSPVWCGRFSLAWRLIGDLWLEHQMSQRRRDWLLPLAGQPSTCSCGASFLRLCLGASCLWPFGWWKQAQDVDSGVEFIPGEESGGLGCEGCMVMGHQGAVPPPPTTLHSHPERSRLGWPWTL